MALLHFSLILFLEPMGQHRQALLLVSAEHGSDEQFPGLCHFMPSSVSLAKSSHRTEPRVGELHDP